jgi:hypothetical protein
MGETYARAGLARSRDAAGLMQGGEPFGAVEETTDECADLTQNAKAALWLLAFSMRAPEEQLRDARSHVAALG